MVETMFKFFRILVLKNVLAKVCPGQAQKLVFPNALSYVMKPDTSNDVPGLFWSVQVRHLTKIQVRQMTYLDCFEASRYVI